MERHPRHPKDSKGMTLPELLMVITIIGVLMALGIDSGLREWRREKVNKVAIELAGWLENARRAALRGESCSITINTGNLSDAGTLATASCMARFPLVINNNDASIAYSITAPTTQFSFTPRGTLFPSDANVSITIALNPDQGVARCVAVQGLLGTISPGTVSGGACSVNQRF